MMTKNIALFGFIWNIAVSWEKMVEIWSAKYLNLNLVYAKIWLHCVQLSLHIFYLCNSKVVQNTDKATKPLFHCVLFSTRLWFQDNFFRLSRLLEESRIFDEHSYHFWYRKNLWKKCLSSDKIHKSN